MNNIFNSVPLPDLSSPEEYYCGRGTCLLFYKDCSKNDFDAYCKKLESSGCRLYQSNIIEDNEFRTYFSDLTVHTYYCEGEKIMRVIADPDLPSYSTKPECGNDVPPVLWQFEVDHSLIDCGMCYFVRCGDGSFFVIDSAHTYSVNDDIRICEFLKKINGGKKPVVSGWFFSHAHDDHICKFLDVIDYHKNDIDIKAVYYNFPSADNEDGVYWGTPAIKLIERFETTMDKNEQVKKIRLHAGQHFYIGNLEFDVLCTHEDVFPAHFKDFNNTSVSLMMKVGGGRVLFPGDSSAESDKIIIKRYKDFLKCDVVQMSHHGHSGTSPEFYRRADAECVLFPITEIKFDEELPRQESNRVAINIAKEYHIASNGTVEIPLPYVYGQTKVLPDETFEDFNGIYNLWAYEYTDERKQQLYNDFLKRSGKSE